MGLIIEHKIIAGALAKAGLRIGSLNAEKPTVDLTRTIFVGWSSRRSLLLSPEYAYLSLSGVEYIQLPQPLAALRQELEGQSLPSQPPPELSVLSVPLGQWQWALPALELAYEARGNGEALARLHNLQRFAAEHWPGWYETALSRLRHVIDSGLSARRQIEILGRQADAVAICEACRPLFTWAAGGSETNRIATLLDAISYALQNLAEIDEVNEIARRDSWWNDLGADLLSCESPLAALELRGGEAEEFVRAELRLLGNRNEAIERAVAVKRLADDALMDAHKALQDLVCTLDNLAQFRSRTIVAIRSIT